MLKNLFLPPLVQVSHQKKKNLFFIPATDKKDRENKDKNFIVRLVVVERMASTE